MYLAFRAGGRPMQRSLWHYVKSGVLIFYDLTMRDIERIEVLMEQYRDIPMDLADASLVAASEQLGIVEIFTIDSDFYVYLRNNKDPFQVVP
jgi:uncharacterized protein